MKLIPTPREYADPDALQYIPPIPEGMDANGRAEYLMIDNSWVPQAKELIKGFEGLRLTAYDDKGSPAIGYGSRSGRSFIRSRYTTIR